MWLKRKCQTPGYENEEEILEYYTEDEIRSDLLLGKLLDKLMSYTTVTEAQDSTEAAAE